MEVGKSGHKDVGQIDEGFRADGRGKIDRHQRTSSGGQRFGSVRSKEFVASLGSLVSHRFLEVRVYQIAACR